MEDLDNLTQQLDELKNGFYDTNKKAVFSKNSQKAQLATHIVSNIELQVLLQATFKSHENEIYINYPLFKQFAHKDIYAQIIDYLRQLIENVLKRHIEYHCHVDVTGFSVSAAQRYNDIIEMFNGMCQNNDRFVTRLVSMHLYHLPNNMKNIYSFLHSIMDRRVIDKVIIH